nr:YtxH domain-containing protein [uncultured Dyadobacter sp.]
MSGKNIILGIVTAAIAGVAIGMLIAPDDGKKTIKKLRKKTNSLAGDLIAALEKSKEKAAEAADELKNEGSAYANEAADKVEGYVETARGEAGKL